MRPTFWKVDDVDHLLKIFSVDRNALKDIAAVTSRILRVEGMEAHARAADMRLTTYFPDDKYDFEVYKQPITQLEKE